MVILKFKFSSNSFLLVIIIIIIIIITIRPLGSVVTSLPTDQQVPNPGSAVGFYYPVYRDWVF